MRLACKQLTPTTSSTTSKPPATHQASDDSHDSIQGKAWGHKSVCNGPRHRYSLPAGVHAAFELANTQFETKFEFVSNLFTIFTSSTTAPCSLRRLASTTPSAFTSRGISSNEDLDCVGTFLASIALPPPGIWRPNRAASGGYLSFRARKILYCVVRRF